MKDIVITRGALAQLGSLTGGVGLLFAVLALIWQGGISGLVLVPAGIGVLGILLWAWMTPQEFVAFITGRQARRGTVSIFSTLLLIGIVALVYIITQRETLIADMTIDNRFTLSPETQDVLDVVARSPRAIEILAFYYPQQTLEREIDTQYMQLYVAASDGRIRLNIVNPLEQPLFSERYRDAIDQGNNIFVSFLNDDGTLDPTSTLAVTDSGLQERDLTEALARLLAAGQFVVYLETSLETLDPLANDAQGLSRANNFMRANGYITEPLSLQALAANGENIPQDASALVIARPRRQMSDAEIAVVAEYVERGGALFIAGDVLYSDDLFLDEASRFNQYLWQTFGLRLLNAVAIDPPSSGRNELELVSAAVFGNNQIASGLNIEGRPESVTLFDLARVVEVDETPPVSNGRVILTTPLGWGETDWEALATRNAYANDEASDLQGPVTTVAWAHNEDTGAKLVLVGDGDFLTNGLIQTPPGNAQLFLNSIGWMTGFSEAVGFEPQAFVTTPVLFVSGTTLDAIAFFTVILMPGVMLVAAFGIWARRLR